MDRGQGLAAVLEGLYLCNQGRFGFPRLSTTAPLGGRNESCRSDIHNTTITLPGTDFNQTTVVVFRHQCDYFLELDDYIGLYGAISSVLYQNVNILN